MNALQWVVHHERRVTDSRDEMPPAVRPYLLAAGGGAELLLLAGPAAHASDLLEPRAELAEIVADWLHSALLAPKTER